MAATGTTSPVTGRFFIPGLDGIRAMAVLLVFLFHAQVFRFVPGELGTTAFFFLSGFLITTLFVREWKKTGDISLGGFYYRRALRTLPPLYIALAAAWLLNSYMHVGNPAAGPGIAANFFNYTNYALISSGNDQMFLPGMVLLWSLAVDEHYYILFAPVFRKAMKKLTLPRIAWGILFLCLLCLAWRLFLVIRRGEVSYHETMGTDTRMESILWGAFLALWRNPALEPEKAASLAKPLPVALGLIGIALPIVSKSWELKATVGYTLEGISFIPLFTVAILQGGKGVLKFLHWPCMLWISKVSYSIYLFQWLMLTACYQYLPGPKLVGFGVAFVGTLIIAAAMSYLVEQPLARMRKKNREGWASAPQILVPAEATAG